MVRSLEVLEIGKLIVERLDAEIEKGYKEGKVSEKEYLEWQNEKESSTIL